MKSFDLEVVVATAIGEGIPEFVIERARQSYASAQMRYVELHSPLGIDENAVARHEGAAKAWGYIQARAVLREYRKSVSGAI